VKTLYLLRHAKSSWDDPGLTDHDRPLAPRGRKAARRIASHLSRTQRRPRLVLCSSATRARQTWDAIAGVLGATAEVVVEDALYGADAVELLARLHEVPEAVEAVLVVGHNPALQDLASWLAGGGDPGSLGRLRDKFPTGAMATLSTEGAWDSLGAEQAYLVALVAPRDLPD
jgi:phosphohistidine phosphatase